MISDARARTNWRSRDVSAPYALQAACRRAVSGTTEFRELLILNDRAAAALSVASASGVRLGDDDEPPPGAVVMATMHRSKGLEFRVVVCMGCEDAQIPPTAVLRDVVDPSERAAAIERERNVLYVACTRARERLLVTWTGKASPLVPGAVRTEVRAP